MTESVAIPQPGSNDALTPRGAILLGAIAWCLITFSAIICASRTGLIRPPGMYGGSCLGGVGDDCMTRLVHQQELGDLYFFLSALIASSIPAWSLAWICYRRACGAKKVLQWGLAGALGLIAIDNIFPVAFAFVLLDVKPAVALESVRTVRHKPWGLNKIAVLALDLRVLASSKSILASNDIAAQHELVEYAGSGQPGEQWREILLKVADGANTPAKEQALICLGWLGDPRNLDFLGNELFKDEDAAAAVPYHLARNYGKDGETYIRRCLEKSPNMRVRFACAQQLMLKKKPEAFKFYLNNLGWNNGRMRSNILQEMRDWAGGSNLQDRDLPAFLAKRAGGA